MSRTNKLMLAKAMIAFSLVLIFTGIAYSLEDAKKLIDPIKDTYVIKEDNHNISITTTEEPVATEEDANSKTTPSENQPATSKEKSPSNSQTQTVTPPVVIDANANLRADIQSRYGITVKYGSETTGYTVSGLTTTQLIDTNKITQVLQELNNNLATYPAGFFQEMKKNGYTLTIYLIKRYSTANVTGITDSTSKNVQISIATDYSFAESFHHELYHFIEKYIFYKGARYTTWNNLNPTNFQYGTANNSLSYNVTYSSSAYFVNNYAQTDEYEDRASTFEYMTAKAEASCLQTGTPIWLKAKYIASQIEAIYQSVNPNTTEYWERYIYN